MDKYRAITPEELDILSGSVGIEMDDIKDCASQLMEYGHGHRVKCPHCGYDMPIWYDDTGQSKGLFVRCKGKKCKKEFEIKIK